MRKREGIEPRYWDETVNADLLRNREGNTEGAKRQGFQGFTGVKDRGTSSRQSRELGRSHELLRRGVRQDNRQTGRKPEGSWEVGCPDSSDEMVSRSKLGDIDPGISDMQ